VRPELKGSTARLALGTVVINQGKNPEPAQLEWRIYDANGKQLPGTGSASGSTPLQPDQSGEFTAAMEIVNPARPVLTPAKLAITTKRVELRASVPEPRARI
jgi:hypothetical protein